MSCPIQSPPPPPPHPRITRPVLPCRERTNDTSFRSISHRSYSAYAASKHLPYPSPSYPGHPSPSSPRPAAVAVPLPHPAPMPGGGSAARQYLTRGGSEVSASRRGRRPLLLGGPGSAARWWWGREEREVRRPVPDEPADSWGPGRDQGWDRDKGWIATVEDRGGPGQELARSHIDVY